MEPILLKTNYYDHFSCLAEKCNYHCCQNWSITVNKQDYAEIKKAKKSKDLERQMQGFFKRNRNLNPSTAEIYATFSLGENGLCRALGEDGLCRLQVECGYPTLPTICKSFPRIRKRIGLLYEESMSTACERVVQILLDSSNGLFFRKEVPDKKDLLKIAYPLGSMIDHTKKITTRPIWAYYEDIRMLCLAILQDRRHPFHDRMIFLGMALEKLNKLETEDQLDQIPAWRNDYIMALRADYNLEKYVDALPLNPVHSFIYGLRAGRMSESSPNYADCLKKVYKRFDIKTNEEGTSGNVEKYQKALKHLDKHLKGREYFFENLMVNLFFTQTMPFSQESIWHDYMLFCMLYSYFRLMAAAIMGPKKTDEDLINIITICSRYSLHNEGLQKALVEHLAATGNNTLGHMAVLLQSETVPLPVDVKK